MGFLNHATNNVIIDAVLTERGRELLARNDGSFNISAFSFGDDEIDYSIIEKYGLTIGKEKIEKNTPVFEANPNENIAIKHPLITFTSNNLQTLTKIPTLIRGDVIENSEIQLDSQTSSTSDNTRVQKTINVKNYVPLLTGIDTLNENITDNRLYIKLHSDILSIINLSPIDTDINNISTYSIPTSIVNGGQWTNQVSGTFTINTQGIVSAEDFTKFSSLSNTNVINTKVQIIGASSGASIIIPIKITLN